MAWNEGSTNDKGYHRQGCDWGEPEPELRTNCRSSDGVFDRRGDRLVLLLSLLRSEDGERLVESECADTDRDRLEAEIHLWGSVGLGGRSETRCAKSSQTSTKVTKSDREKQTSK